MSKISVFTSRVNELKNHVLAYGKPVHLEAEPDHLKISFRFRTDLDEWAYKFLTNRKWIKRRGIGSNSGVSWCSNNIDWHKGCCCLHNHHPGKCKTCDCVRTALLTRRIRKRKTVYYRKLSIKTTEYENFSSCLYVILFLCLSIYGINSLFNAAKSLSGNMYRHIEM